jgi:catechol 2,3-dioxygenase-like lactoylglutathione lyase family enzyme
VSLQWRATRHIVDRRGLPAIRDAMSLTPPHPSDRSTPPPAPSEEDPDARLEEAVIAAREAAIRAFTTALDHDGQGAVLPEVRLMVTATRGNPSAEYSTSEVRFAAPDGVAISHHDKIAMALASMKAVSPEIYSTMMAGISRGRRVTLGGLRACLKAAAR